MPKVILITGYDYKVMLQYLETYRFRDKHYTFYMPEVNLHPSEQIRFILDTVHRVVGLDATAIIATQSDYIVNEVNTMVMLSNDFEGKEAFMQKYKYQPCHILQPTDVEMTIHYFENEYPMEQVEVTKNGFAKTVFDDVQERFNAVQDIFLLNPNI